MALPCASAVWKPNIDPDSPLYFELHPANNPEEHVPSDGTGDIRRYVKFSGSP